ncbi:MAG: nucleoside diphosphate kinase regulator [Nitrospiraceae bacterium]
MMKGRDGMESRDIYITEYDLKRLKELVQVGISFAERDRESLEKLQGELDRAHIVEPTAVPGDVVTMNSRVRFKDLDTNQDKVYTLVFPSEAKLEQQKISVLAPIGTAILGYRVGDTVEWRVPGGIKRVRIEEILYQPEAQGQYSL